MIGLYPTVGCLVILSQLPLEEARTEVLAKVHSLLWQSTGEQSSAKPLYVSAVLAASQMEAILYAQEAQIGICVFINFDEEQVVHLARQTGLNIEELLSPYIAAMKTVSHCKGIGIGFELSPPLGTGDQCLKDAGISQYFEWDVANTRWTCKHILPMVGHYL